MVSAFIDHIRQKNLFDQGCKYLLAVSAGADSVALGHLLRAAAVDFEVAHVNFGLRGEESDGDEAFVKSLGSKWGVEVHVKKITLGIFSEPGSSLQMKARDIRYQWFEETLKSRGLQGVLVAHHFEDQIETILLNLLRGSGLEGVYGMSERRGNIIRPLLPFRRGEILEFMQTNQYEWREDSSNRESKYKRNYIRNEILPLIEEKFPAGIRSLGQSFQRIKDSGKAFFYLYQVWKEQHVKVDNGYQFLELKDFISLPGKHSLLFYWLRDYGFGTADIEDIVACAERGDAGKIFFAGNYTLNLDRGQLILAEKSIDWESFEIQKDDIRLVIKDEKYDILRVGQEFTLDRDPTNAMLDLDKLSFPLTVRKWESGDRMVPLGMKSEKKISDILIDRKLPLIEKEKIAVILSGSEIIWLVGHRISDRFKCDSESKNILYLKKIKS